VLQGMVQRRITGGIVARRPPTANFAYTAAP
jgi:hypothetical protein